VLSGFALDTLASMSQPPNIKINAATFIDAQPVSRLQLLVIVLCGLVVLFDGLDTQVIGYLGPALSAEWNIPRAQLGPVFSASQVGLVAGLLIIGACSDRLGRRLSIIVSVMLFAVFTLLTAFAQGVTDLMIYRLLAGIGLGGAMPNALALTGEYCPKRLRATLVIIMFCGFSLGSILGGIISTTFLDTLGWSWRSVFITGAVLPLLLLPVLWFKLPESLQFLMLETSRKQQRLAKAAVILHKINPQLAATVDMSAQPAAVAKVPVTDLFTANRARGTLMLWVVFFMNLMVFYFLQSWLPTLFTDTGLSQRSAVLMATLISVGGIVAGILSGPLMDRYNAYKVLAALYLGGAIFVACIGIATPAVLALVTFAAGFCVSGGQKSVNALAVIFYPTYVRSTGVGWALGIGRFGSILGPVLAGWLLGWGWMTASLLQMAALPMLLAALLIYAMGASYAGNSEGDRR
jgi:MFS transporter, AAHS family, 4-hydroxybenzoate transporter